MQIKDMVEKITEEIAVKIVAEIMVEIILAILFEEVTLAEQIPTEIAEQPR